MYFAFNDIAVSSSKNRPLIELFYSTGNSELVVELVYRTKRCSRKKKNHSRWLFILVFFIASDDAENDKFDFSL
jgi:hypothetical protein